MSLYFSNYWEMLNTEQIKMSQSKLTRSTSIIFNISLLRAVFEWYRSLQFTHTGPVFTKDHCFKKNGAYSSIIGHRIWNCPTHKPSSKDRSIMRNKYRFKGTLVGMDLAAHSLIFAYLKSCYMWRTVAMQDEKRKKKKTTSLNYYVCHMEKV